MTPALKAARRLVGSLERVVAREGVLLRSGHFAEMAAIQRRASPLIAHLCRLGSEPGVSPAVGERVSALLARRRDNLSLLAARRTFLAAERARVADRLRRVQFLAPYGGPVRPSRPGRLSAAV